MANDKQFRWTTRLVATRGVKEYKVYFDLSGFSGYRSLLDVIALLTMYATVLRPEAIIVKSGALKHFALHCLPWSAESAPVRSEAVAGPLSGTPARAGTLSCASP